MRLHGTGEVVIAQDSDFETLRRLFSEYPGVRAVIRARLHRISDSCGYAVPRYEYVGERDGLVRWADSKGPDGLAKYRSEENHRSVDGLPGLDSK